MRKGKTLKACMLQVQSRPPAVGAEPQQLASPFAATVQRALAGSLFDGRDVPLTKLTRQLSINLAESRARARSSIRPSQVRDLSKQSHLYMWGHAQMTFDKPARLVLQQGPAGMLQESRLPFNHGFLKRRSHCRTAGNLHLKHV